jgi:hypothetical protein
MTRRILIATFTIGLLHLASMLWATAGRPSLPVDDSFIYFQYAQRAADGQPFVYQRGEGPTTGTTSVPWMAALAGAALLGFRGKAMIFLSMLLGGLLLAVAARCAAETQRALAPRRPGDERPGDLAIGRIPLAGALVLLSGPLHWGAWSGMEIALTAAAILAAFREWVRAGGRPGLRPALAGAALATVRPEGALLALWLPLFWGAAALLRRESWRNAAWGVLPLAGALFQPVLYLIVTGEPRSTGYLAKSLLAEPGIDPVSVARIALLRAASLATGLFGGVAPFVDGRGLYAYDSIGVALFVAPGAAVLFLIGVLPALAREGGERHAGPGALALAWIGTLLLATSLIEEPDAHFNRYQMPVLPLFLVWVAMGVGRLERALRDRNAGLARLAAGIRGYLALFGVASVVFFIAAFGDNAADIDRMQIRFGETLRRTLDPGDVVALNDAGAIAYFSERRTLDLIGLTTPGFAGLWTQGSGALWEKLESLDPDRRPDWFCIFPNWFEFDGLDLLRRVGSVRLRRPSIVDAEKVLYRADWSRARSGDAPRVVGPDGEAPRTVDRLDVADVASETAHRFRWDDGERESGASTFVRRADFPRFPGDEVVDGGRTVFHEATFELETSLGEPTALVVRTVSGVRQRLLISVDESPDREREVYAAGTGRFHDAVIATIPPGEGPVRIRLRVRPDAASSAPLVLAHVFSLAGVSE